jgi:glycosyltransferase involved in cell wall biosynthesis
MKIAIVHDWLYGGGAEKVVEELHTIYPDAPIYTAFATQEWRQKLDGKVVTGILGKWPLSKLYKFTPLFQQWWFKGLNLSDYDVVISSCGNGAARFAQVKKPALHIAYTHTPTHYYWRKYDEYLKDPSFRPKWLVRLGLKILVGYLRKQDFEAAQKIDYFIANSEHIASDILSYYQKESVVIHPPVDTAKFALTSTEQHDEKRFVMWGRHVPYKRFDIAVEACNRLGAKLVMMGSGPATEQLKALAGPTVKLIGWTTPEQMQEIASSSSAFIAPMEEDFGIAPVEAMSAGLPVIAYKAGGAIDYVVDGKTGMFFNEQSVESLVEALEKFDASRFDSKCISDFAKDNFDKLVFRKKIQTYISNLPTTRD